MMDLHGVVLEDTLPLRVQMGALEISAHRSLMADNLALLRALLVMDEHLPSEEENREALSNLETKIDLLILLVSNGIQGLEPLPPSYPCLLGGHDLVWETTPSEDAPINSGEVCVVLFLRPRIAMPLFLPGVLQISSIPDSLSAAETLVRHHLRFQLDERVQESLDRLIFRHHRRAVARRKDQIHPSVE